MKPYSAYKDSDIPWIGKVPVRWETNKVKYLAEYINGAAFKPTDWSNEGLKIIRIQNLTDPTAEYNHYSEELDSKYLIHQNDVLISWSASLGVHIWVEEKPAWLNQHIFKVSLNEGVIDKGFYIWLAKWFIVEMQKEAHGSTMQHLTKDKFGSFLVYLPSLPEQRAIAAYLDRKTTQIDALIANKRRRVELLNEERTALISHAVTKGLDPDAPLKDSGVEWIGEIPVGWEVKRLKFVAHFKSGEGITANLINEKGDYPVYGGNGVRGYTSSYTHEGSFVLIGRQGALCGNINYATGRFWASEHAVVATLLQNYALVWFGELLRTMNLNQYSQSAAQPGLAVEFIKNLFIPVPNFPEQRAIAAYLNEKTASIDRAIAHTEQQITLLQEYRTALISAAVTGKIDVRLGQSPTIASVNTPTSNLVQRQATRPQETGPISATPSVNTPTSSLVQRQATRPQETGPILEGTQ